jgi:hypothetical protein
MFAALSKFSDDAGCVNKRGSIVRQRCAQLIIVFVPGPPDCEKVPRHRASPRTSFHVGQSRRRYKSGLPPLDRPLLYGPPFRRYIFLRRRLELYQWSAWSRSTTNYFLTLPCASISALIRNAAAQAAACLIAPKKRRHAEVAVVPSAALASSANTILMLIFKCPYCRAEYEMTTARLSFRQRSYAKCHVCQRTMYSWNARNVPLFTLVNASNQKTSRI